MEKNIFSEYLNKPSLFKNKDVLSVSFIPEKIPHRDNEIKQIVNVLSPVLKGHATSNIFIYGKTGTGKTICMKFVLDELKKVIQDDNKIKSIYINCKMKKVADTEYRLLAYLLRSFGENVPDTGLPTDVLYRKFFKLLDNEKQNIIIVLDEIDALVKKIGDEFLYNLTRVDSELKKGKLTIVGISNDLSFTDNIDSRVKSSLGEEELIFPPYNALELRDILLERSKEGFVEGCIDESVINKCSALAAQEHGDARRALDLLRVAGEIAERTNSKKITERHVDLAEEKIDLDRVTEIVKNQPRQSQAVLFSIIKTNNEKIMTGDVFDNYREICKNNGLKILTQRRVSDLIAELDMLGIVTTKVISKGRYGRTREISLAIENKVLDRVKKILKENFGE